MNLQRKKEIIQEYYLDITSNWYSRPKLSFVTTLRTTAGRALCYHWENQEYPDNEIELNLSILDANPLISGIDTLLHELAHIITNCKYSEDCNHDKRWKICYATLTGKSMKEVSRCHSLVIPTKQKVKVEVKGELIL